MRRLLAGFVLGVIAIVAGGQAIESFTKFTTSRPSATVPLTGTEPLVIVQGGISKQVPANQFAQFAGSASSPQAVTAYPGYFEDGWDVTKGTSGDAVFLKGNASGTIVSILKGIFNNVLTPISVTGSFSTTVPTPLVVTVLTGSSLGASPVAVAVAGSPVSVTCIAGCASAGASPSTVVVSAGNVTATGSPQSVIVIGSPTVVPTGTLAVSPVANEFVSIGNTATVSPVNNTVVSIGNTAVVSGTGIQEVSCFSGCASAGASPTTVVVSAGNVTISGTATVSPQAAAIAVTPSNVIGVNLVGSTPTLTVSPQAAAMVVTPSNTIGVNCIAGCASAGASPSTVVISAGNVTISGTATVSPVANEVVSLGSTATVSPSAAAIAVTPSNVIGVNLVGATPTVTVSLAAAAIVSVGSVIIANQPSPQTVVISAGNVTLSGTQTVSPVNNEVVSLGATATVSPQAAAMVVTPANVIGVNVVASGTLTVSPSAATISVTPSNVIGVNLVGSTPTVTVSPNTAAMAVTPSNVIGVNVSGTAIGITTTVSTTGWTPTYINNLTNTVQTVVTGRHQLGKIYCDNGGNVSPTYVSIFDAASNAVVTTGVTTPKSFILLPGTVGIFSGFVDPLPGDQFANGILIIAITPTPMGQTAPTSKINCTLSYN